MLDGENEEVVNADYMNDGDEDVSNVNMYITTSQAPCAFFVWYNAGKCTSARRPHGDTYNDKISRKRNSIRGPSGENRRDSTNNPNTFSYDTRSMESLRGVPDVVASRCKVGIVTECDMAEPNHESSIKRRRNKRLPLAIAVTCLERNIKLEALSADSITNVVWLTLPRGLRGRETSLIKVNNDKNNSFLERLGADYDTAISIKSSQHSHHSPSRVSWWNEVVLAGSEVVIGKIKKMIEACVSHNNISNNMMRNRSGQQLNEEMLRALRLQERAKRLIMACSAGGISTLSMEQQLKSDGKPKPLMIKHVKANPFRHYNNGIGEDLEDLSECSGSLDGFLTDDE